MYPNFFYHDRPGLVYGSHFHIMFSSINKLECNFTLRRARLFTYYLFKKVKINNRAINVSYIVLILILIYFTVSFFLAVKKNETLKKTIVSHDYNITVWYNQMGTIFVEMSSGTTVTWHLVIKTAFMIKYIKSKHVWMFIMMILIFHDIKRKCNHFQISKSSL